MSRVAFLADDDAALGIDGVRRHQGRRHHLAQDVQAGVDGLVLGVRQLQHIGGLVEAGEGVGVGAEGQTQPFKNAHHLVLGHVLGAVEGHMLHEVGQTLLVVALHQRTGVDAQAERRLAGRGRILQQGVAHPVRQQAVADGGVGRDVAGRLGPRVRRRDLGGRGGDGRCALRIGDGDEAGRKGQAGSRDEQQTTRRTHGITPKTATPDGATVSGVGEGAAGGKRLRGDGCRRLKTGCETTTSRLS